MVNAENVVTPSNSRGVLLAAVRTCSKGPWTSENCRRALVAKLEGEAGGDEGSRADLLPRLREQAFPARLLEEVRQLHAEI